MTTVADADNPFANQALMALSPKIPALLSILGSYIIIREVTSDLRGRSGRGGRSRNDHQRASSSSALSRTLLRTLLALSIADLFYSVPWFLTTWPAPREIPYLWGNVGTVATCTAQGVIFQFGFITEPTFNVLYALYSLLMVRCQWSSRQFRRVEPWVQIAVWAVAFCSAVLPIFFGIYNSSGQICWYSDYPVGCRDRADVACVRGEGYQPVVYTTIAYVLLCIIVGGILMFLIYRSVRKLETRIARFSARSYGLRLSSAASSAAAAAATTTTTNTNTNRQSGSRSTIGAAAAAVAALVATSVAASADTSSQHSSSVQGRINEADASENTLGSIPSGSIPSESQRSRTVSATRREQRKRSRSVREHAIYYMTAFLLTYSLSLIEYLMMLFFVPIPPALDFFAFVLLPMQGFFNVIIFCLRRPVMATPEGVLFRRICCLGCEYRDRRAVDSSESPRPSFEGQASSGNNTSNSGGGGGGRDPRRHRRMRGRSPPRGGGGGNSSGVSNESSSLGFHSTSSVQQQQQNQPEPLRMPAASSSSKSSSGASGGAVASSAPAAEIEMTAPSTDQGDSDQVDQPPPQSTDPSDPLAGTAPSPALRRHSDRPLSGHFSGTATGRALRRHSDRPLLSVRFADQLEEEEEEETGEEEEEEEVEKRSEEEHDEVPDV